MKRSRAKTLAASFVAITALPACKKTLGGGERDPEPDRSASVWRAENGTCQLMAPVSCPKNATCNPPAPDVIDCPPSHRDAGDPPGVTRRPPGKESWVRVRPHLWAGPPTYRSDAGASCTYQGERFCAPPGSPYECTPWESPIDVKCAPIPGSGDAGSASIRLESFVYKDGVGACHHIASMVCRMPGECAVPDGDPIPCP